MSLATNSASFSLCSTAEAVVQQFRRFAEGIGSDDANTHVMSASLVADAVHAISISTSSPREQAVAALDVAAVAEQCGVGALESRKACEFAVRLADSVGDRSLRRKSLTYLGIMQHAHGDALLAVETLSEAILLAHDLQDNAALCLLWNNLGVAFLNVPDFDDAKICFEDSLNLSEAYLPLRAHRAFALQNLAHCHLNLREIRIGLRYAESALMAAGVVESSRSALDRIFAETTYAWLLLEAGDTEKAFQRICFMRDLVKRAHSVKAELALQISEGLYEVRIGKLDIGMSRLSYCRSKTQEFLSLKMDAVNALVCASEWSHDHAAKRTYLDELAQMRGEQTSSTARQALRALDQTNRRTVARDEKAAIDALQRLAIAAEMRDDSTGQHSYRVGKLTALLAERLGYDSKQCKQLDLAARLHDVGKIGTPDSILLKPGKLSLEETRIMHAHTTIGANILRDGNTEEIRMAERIARHHHERWDGAGYPDGLHGEHIPKISRIAALADVYDALTHKRPYKEPWTVDEALAEISRQSGRHFDPEIVPIFIDLIRALRVEHEDLDGYLGQEAFLGSFVKVRAALLEVRRSTAS